MTYENIKTIILTLLVTMSILFTWGIWTYQPQYETMVNTKTVPEVSLSEQKDIKEIIKPDRIMYHYKDSHYGTYATSEIDLVMKELSQWNFDRSEEVSLQLEKNILTRLEENGGYAEIIFPDNVPMELYQSILNMKNKDANEIQFDRIFIDMENMTKENGYVYFISIDKERAFRMPVTASFVTNFKENFYELAPSNLRFSEYVVEPLSEQRSIFVRTEPVNVSSYTYLLDLLPTEKFRDALFSDPSFVKRTYTKSGEEYTDSTKLLSVNYNTNTILYVNPSQENTYTGNINNLLQQSVDFVNGHGGWTDNYRYVGIDEFEQTVLYRIYDAYGHPIFNNNGMSEILQIWGQSGVKQYMRNNFSIDRLVETSEVSLMSGIDVLEGLRKNEDFNVEFLQDLCIGYEMQRDFDGPLIHLKPAWFYKYNDQWWLVPSISGEGTDHGLE